MTTGIAVLLMILFAPFEIYIYLTQGEEASYEFMGKVAGGFFSVMEFLLNERW